MCSGASRGVTVSEAMDKPLDGDGKLAERVKRGFQRNRETIAKMDMSKKKRQEAYTTLRKLTEAEMQEAILAEGRKAKLDESYPHTESLTVKQYQQRHREMQDVSRGYIKASNNVTNYMAKLEKQQKKVKERKELNGLRAKLNSATEQGKLQVTINGITYYRPKKKSLVWKVGSREDYLRRKIQAGGLDLIRYEKGWTK